MTKEGLEKVRFATPTAIAIFAAAIGVWFLPFDKDQRTTFCWLIPILSGGLGAIYAAAGLRLVLWRKEMSNYVGQQIRNAYVAMIPEDIQITPEEKLKLFEKAVWKDLTGLFWETIDNDPYLVGQKPMFYANGAFYTGAIDCYIIMTFFSFVYLVLFFCGLGFVHLILAIFCLAIGLFSRGVVLPMRRKKHLQLSEEQLDVLRDKHLEEIQDKIRKLVRDWRLKKSTEINS